MHEYRCTRVVLYLADCPGKTDLSSRQGHYVVADSPEAARREMAESFPQDLPRAAEHGVAAFTADLWKKNVR